MELRMIESRTGRIFFEDKDGTRFNKVGYRWSSGFYDDGIACVIRTKDGCKNYLRKDGTFISSEWFIKGDDGFSSGFAKVMCSDGEWRYLDYEGNLYLNKPV